jgi:hypothetical protein
MHNRSIGLEGEKRLRSCKRKLNTIIGFVQNSHWPNKVNFSMPQQSNPSIKVQENSTFEFLDSHV